jgi:hypothetical protein
MQRTDYARWRTDSAGLFAYRNMIENGGASTGCTPGRAGEADSAKRPSGITLGAASRWPVH